MNCINTTTVDNSCALDVNIIEGDGAGGLPVWDGGSGITVDEGSLCLINLCGALQYEPSPQLQLDVHGRVKYEPPPEWKCLYCSTINLMPRGRCEACGGARGEVIQ